MTTAAVFGTRGYLGREVVRLLLGHPRIDTIVPVSGSEAGRSYASALPAFHGTDLAFATAEEALATAPDVAFFATSAGEASAWAPKVGDAIAIDLSRDHRHVALDGGGADGWVYGLADLRPVAEGSRRIANPGCYPTAAMLASAPALQSGLADAGPIIVDGKSGVSGAGATAREDLHFPAANESVRAYKVVGHDHQEEMRGVAGLLAGTPRRVRFTPHLVPMNRGLLATVYMQTARPADDVKAAYRDAYSETRFVHVRGEPDTAHVRGSNHAVVAVDVDEGVLVARCAIDNLLKGGSGTAVQNMNDTFGWPSDMGLQGLGAGV